MHRIALCVIALSMNFIGNSLSARAHGWAHREAEQIYSRGSWPNTPLCAVWRLLQSVTEGDQDTFRALYGELPDEACDRLFQSWQSRMKNELPVAITRIGSFEDSAAYVGLFSWQAQQTFPAGKSKETFVDIVFLKRLEGKWRIDPNGWEQWQQEGFPMRDIMGELYEVQQAREKKAYDDALERYSREGQEMLWKSWTPKYPDVERRVYEIVRSMTAKGIDIPDSYGEMFEQYAAVLFTPPQAFDAEPAPKHVDRKSWRDVFRYVLHERWQNGELAAKTGKLGTVRDDRKTDVQVLATVSREVDDKTIRFVYYNVFDGSSGLADQWVTTSMIILSKDQTGLWMESPAWENYPGIVHRQDIRFGEGAAALVYRRGTDGAQKGAVLEKILEAAGLPAPFDRIYSIEECDAF